VSKQRVEEEWTIVPSVYHLAGYEPQTTRSAEEAAELRTELAGLAVSFVDEAVEVDVDDRESVSRAAGVILQADDRVRFLISALAKDEGAGAMELARKQAAAVGALLMEYGVAETQLEMQVFVATLDGAPAGRVEYLLK
jgi:hypothetical protein